MTEYEYDNLGRKTSETDPEEGVTTYTYDSAGRMTSLTDPEENTTYWSYSPLGQVATETINVDSTDLVRYYYYDARGNLARKIDRNGRVIDYAYDNLSRQTTETWYDDVTDADAQQDAVTTYATTYDEMGRVATIGDGDYDFDYSYSILGNLTSTTQDLTGLTDDVVFNYSYTVGGCKPAVLPADRRYEGVCDPEASDEFGSGTSGTVNKLREEMCGNTFKLYNCKSQSSNAKFTLPNSIVDALNKLVPASDPIPYNYKIVLPKYTCVPDAEQDEYRCDGSEDTTKRRTDETCFQEEEE